MTVQLSRATILLAVCFPLLCAAQESAPPKAPPAPPTVYSNPRSGPDDPRVGLKGGLYDAGEAAFGLQRIITLPKPPGFAPGDDATTRTAAPAEGASAAAGGAQYGSTNSDLAFRGKILFVGNYNGINFYDITDPDKIRLTTS